MSNLRRRIRRNRIIAASLAAAAFLSLSALILSNGCGSGKISAPDSASRSDNTAASGDNASETGANPTGGLLENSGGTAPASAGDTSAGDAASGSAPPAAYRLPLGTLPFVWPTPLPVSNKTVWQDIVQAAASGDPATGLFGNARNGGGKFHEGVDIRPHARDKQREPTDIVRAAVPGVVAHLAPISNGPYGRYVVLLHSEPGLNFYTLYAHMRSVAPELREGAIIQAGTTLGIMGRSDGTRGFAKERAHMHFETGLQLSPNFQRWYSRQRDLGSRNLHGIWNGLNLYGCDPLPFLLEGLRTGYAPPMLALVRSEPVAVTVHVKARSTPAFVRENPALLTAPVPRNLAGWKITFAWHGMPLALTPLTTPPQGNAMTVIPTTDAALLRKAQVRGVLSRKKNGAVVAGTLLQNTVDILFAE